MRAGASFSVHCVAVGEAVSLFIELRGRWTAEVKICVVILVIVIGWQKMQMSFSTSLFGL